MSSQGPFAHLKHLLSDFIQAAFLDTHEAKNDFAQSFDT
jgi:hypothetical protein